MYRGIVEGFYGKPFEGAQRSLLIGELSRMDNSAYFYAPKDDPWHRLKWKEPYPEPVWSELARCMGGSVAFFFSVSPWRFADHEWSAAREKLLRARDAGAEGLGILFDDVPESSASELAKRQIDFARRALKDTDCPVVLCPSVYCVELMERHSGGTDYLRSWKENLPDEWRSFWTGPMVVSETLSGLEEAEERLGGEPVIWDNLPATDHCLRRIYLPGFAGRIPEKLWWFVNPSEIFPAALHSVMEIRAASGFPRRWPEALGEKSRGWELLREFNHTPWRTGETGGEILARLRGAMEGQGVKSALQWLEEAIDDMDHFNSLAGTMDGGWQLLLYSRDLQRSLSTIRRALLSRDPKNTLDYLMHVRLPYENPLAALAAGRNTGRQK